LCIKITEQKNHTLNSGKILYGHDEHWTKKKKIVTAVKLDDVGAN